MTEQIPTSHMTITAWNVCPHEPDGWHWTELPPPWVQVAEMMLNVGRHTPDCPCTDCGPTDDSQTTIAKPPGSL